MRRLAIASVVLPCALAVLAAGCRMPVRMAGPTPWRAAPDPLRDALARVGLTPEQFRIDPDDASYFGGARFRQQMWEVFMHDPMKIEPDAKAFRRALLAGAGSVTLPVVFATARLREGVRRGLIGSPLLPAHRAASGPRPLAAAIEALDGHAGRRRGRRERAALARSAASVPDAVARPAAFLLHVLAGVIDWRERALAAVPAAQRAALRARLVDAVAKIDSSDGEDFAALAPPLAEKIDFQALYAGATELALAVDAALDGLPSQPASTDGSGAAVPPVPALPGLRSLAAPAPAAEAATASSDFAGNGTGEAPPGTPAFHFQARTPYGDVVIAGGGQDAHAGSPLLLIDTGGDDTYEGGGGATGSGAGISLLLDLAGDDVYGPARDPATAVSLGSGILGYGYLVDLGGNDRYTGATFTEGVGIFGVGLLLDAAGRDRYAGGVGAQGAGIFGAGILSDLAGDDVYECEQRCQGFGYTLGLGLLVDRAGNDRYTANDTVIDHPSAQTPEHNISLAQGCGSGRRADYSDGLSLAGGIGLLVEGGGDDRYSAGLFAQGAAYWYGVGLLDDAAGDDTYEGVWYVQGSAAHFGVGALLDEGGNDAYHATMTVAQGAGHDFSWGELIDEWGDDRYDAPDLSLGAGNDNGVGFFWDRGGRDVYAASAETALGRANITARRGGLRDRMLCLGVFLDTGGGADSYARPFAGDERTWTQAGRNIEAPLESEKGVGLDR